MHLGNASDNFKQDRRPTTLVFSIKLSALAALSLANQLLNLFLEFDPTD